VWERGEEPGAAGTAVLFSAAALAPDFVLIVFTGGGAEEKALDGFPPTPATADVATADGLFRGVAAAAGEDPPLSVASVTAVAFRRCFRDEWCEATAAATIWVRGWA
jgi:hypothetical protein